MKNKKFILIGIVILILVVILICFLRIKFAKVEVVLKDSLEIEFLSDAKVSDFIKSINGKIINDYDIDTKSIGEKNIKFDFINDDKIKVKYEYKINVVDKVAPVIWLNNSYTIYKGDNSDFSKKILCGDNEDESVECFLDGVYDYNSVGDYLLSFVAKDRSGNEKKQDFTLHVIDKTDTPVKKEETFTLFSDVVSGYKSDKTKIGIDVSGWQKDIDFEKIKNAGVEFIIIKVGGKKENGEYYVDSKFLRNIEEANKYDIPVGLYIYSNAKSDDDAINDANFVIDQIGDKKVDLPIAFDWENWSTFNDYNLSFFGLTNLADVFIKRVEEAGYKGMLYSSKNYLEKIWLENSYSKWLAHYSAKTNYEGDYLFWQMCDDGRVEGIDAPVDIDIMYE